MTLRKLAKHEAGFLSEMLYEALFIEEGEAKHPRSIIEEPHLAKYVADFGSKEFDRCIVAEEDGALVGACWGRLFEANNRGYGFLDAETPELSIAVKESFRNRGIGGGLLAHICEQYREAGIRSISLSADKKNPALKLYERHGFKVELETEKSVVLRFDLET